MALLDDEELLPFFGNPNIQRQGARARALAAQRDVNTLPDPRTYAAVSGLLGTAPDQMGFSVMNPDYQAIQNVARPAYGLGLAAQLAPFLAPITKGLPVGASIKNVGSKFVYPQENALRLAQQRAALPVEQGGLGLLGSNTAEQRATAMGAIDYLHGTERMDRLLAGKNLNPKKATSGPMPFGTNTPAMASNYAMNKADTSLALQNEGNLADYFQVLPKAMGERGTSPINVENVWYRLPAEKKSEILDKASRIGYADPAEASGGFVLHQSSEGAPYAKSHWDYTLNKESRGNPLTALRKTYAESGMLDAYAPSELADIYKLAGFPYDITQTNAPWTSAKGVMTGKAMISNPINTSDTATIKETVIPFLKDQFKSDRTRVKTGGVDQWDKNTRFTPKQWVNQLEDDLSKGTNSFVWTSIPDKVTAQLEKLGFNGILDTGGKMGGEAHQVVIPFRPEQLRSRFAAFDPFRKSAAIAASMGVAAPDLLAAQQDEEMRKLQQLGLLGMVAP
jgi:hypothetical protein